MNLFIFIFICCRYILLTNHTSICYILRAEFNETDKVIETLERYTYKELREIKERRKK